MDIETAVNEIGKVFPSFKIDTSKDVKQLTGSKAVTSPLLWEPTGSRCAASNFELQFLWMNWHNNIHMNEGMYCTHRCPLMSYSRMTFFVRDLFFENR